MADKPTPPPMLRVPDIYIGGKPKDKPKPKLRMNDKLRERGRRYDNRYQSKA